MSNIDKQALHNQQLKAFISGFLSDQVHDNQPSCSMTAEVFRIALASLEAEPIAYTDAEELRFPHATSDMWPVPLGHGMDLPLFAAPPAPVFPEEMAISDDMNLYQKSFAQGHNACRAAMLQAGNSPALFCRRPAQNIVTPGQSSVAPEQGSNHPVVPEGWRLVPVEPTSEMYDAGDRQLATKQVWDAMVAAAPKQEVQ